MAIHVADAGIDIRYTPKVSRTFAWIVFALTFGLARDIYRAIGDRRTKSGAWTSLGTSSI